MLSVRGSMALLLLVGSAACAGKSIDDTGEGGRGGMESGGASGGGAGASSKAGTGQGAGGSDFAGASFGGGASGGAPNECARLDDESPLSVSVQIVNETPRAIHLGPTSPSCGGVALFQVEDPGGGPLREVGGCRTSCELLRAGGAVGCGPACLGWETVTLRPGEVLSTTWSGQYLTDALMPASCLSGRDAESSSLRCDRAMTIRAGRYTFRAQAGTALSCETADACRACSPNAPGGCTTSSATVSGEMKVAATTVDLGRSYGALDAAPPSNPPGASLPAPPVPPVTTVQLVFTE